MVGDGHERLFLRMVKNIMTASDVIQNKAVPFEDGNDFARS